MSGIAGAVLAACVGSLDVEQLAEETKQAMGDVESYRFDARFQVDQAGPGEAFQGSAGMIGAFAAPDRLHVEASGDEALIDEPVEMVFHEGTVYVRTQGGHWQEALLAQVGLFQAAPHLDKLTQWIEDATAAGTMEASRGDLGGRRIHVLSGEWVHEESNEHVEFQAEGTFELWIGTDDSLVRKAAYDINTVIAPRGNRDLETMQRISAEVDFFDYGESVEVPTP